MSGPLALRLEVPPTATATATPSDFAVVEEVRPLHRGMSVVLDAEAWRSFQTTPDGPLAELLLRWATHVDWTPFRKAVRGPKVTRKRDRVLDTPHVSTARLLGRA